MPSPSRRPTSQTILRLLWAIGWGAAIFSARLAYAEGPLVAVFGDGSRVEGPKLEGWFDPDGKPAEIKLGGQNLIDPAKPARFVRDNDLAIKAPSAHLEMTGGDILPGVIEEMRPGGFDGDSPRAMVSLPSPLFAPAEGKGLLPVRAERVARIVARPASRPPLKPGQLQFTDGRTIDFRAARWTRDGLRLLVEGGVQLVRFAEIAEAAFPLKDAAEGLVADSRWAAAWGKPWLMRLETAQGAVLTAPLSIRDSNRMQGRDRRGRTISEVEVEYLQPSWSLAPIRTQLDQAAIRSFRPLDEIPLSLLPAETLARKTLLGVAVPWQRNRTLQGNCLAIGDRQGELGLAIPSYSEVAFDLPAGIREFRGWVGIDRGVGAGGCAQARVFRDQPSGNPLWQSGFLQGKDPASAVGPVNIAGAKRLVLVTDFGHQGRPAGADPLDIRDELVWLHPALTLDRGKFESPQAWRSLALGLEDWQTDDGPAAAVKAALRWSLAEERWDAALTPPDSGITLRRQQKISAHSTDILELTFVVSATNAGQDVPAFLKAVELKVNGEVVPPVCDYENPPRFADLLALFSQRASGRRLNKDSRFKPIAPVALWWDLQKYRGREVSLSLTLKKPAGGELRWRELRLTGAAGIEPDQWPVPQVLLTSLQPTSMSSHKDRGHPAADQSPFKPIRDLTYLGQSIRGGFGMMRNSHLTFAVKPEYKRFTALVGTCAGKVGPYQVLLDGKQAWSIANLDSTQPAELVDLAIPPGTKELTIQVGGTGGYTGFGAFAPAGFVTE